VIEIPFNKLSVADDIQVVLENYLCDFVNESRLIGASDEEDG
jgi:hypothetical protein